LETDTKSRFVKVVHENMNAHPELWRWVHENMNAPPEFWRWVHENMNPLKTFPYVFELKTK
jgi:hypothetical protein